MSINLLLRLIMMFLVLDTNLLLDVQMMGVCLIWCDDFGDADVFDYYDDY